MIGPYEKGGLKSVDIDSKISALQLSWIKRLYDNNNHPWKLIPKYLFKKHFGYEEIFYPNLEISSPDIIPLFYRNIIDKWCDIASCNLLTADAVYAQRIWNNRYIKINNKPVFNKELANYGVNYVRDFYDINGTLKTWDAFKTLCNSKNKFYFTWRQIIDSLPIEWKMVIIEDNGNIVSDETYTQHFLRVTRKLTLDKMSSREFYNIMIAKIFTKPSTEITLQNRLNVEKIDWSSVYKLSGQITIDSYSRMFSFKLNHNILYLNKALTQMGIKNNTFCSFCNNFDETSIHLFSECNISLTIWRSLQLRFDNLDLPDLTPQSAILGFF